MAMMFLYLAAGYVCISIGACIGFVIASIMFEAKHAMERDERFFR